MYVSKELFKELKSTTAQLNNNIKADLYDRSTINFIDNPSKNRNSIGNILSNPIISIASNICIKPAKQGNLFHASYKIGLTRLTARNVLKLMNSLIKLGRKGITKRAEHNIQIQNHVRALQLSMNLY